MATSPQIEDFFPLFFEPCKEPEYVSGPPGACSLSDLFLAHIKYFTLFLSEPNWETNAELFFFPVGQSANFPFLIQTIAIRFDQKCSGPSEIRILVFFFITALFFR